MTAEYWQRRTEEMKHIQDMFNSDAAYNAEIKRIYDRAQREIQKEIDAFITNYAKGENISIADARKQVNKMDVEAFAEKTKKYVKERDFSPQANEELKKYNLRMKMSRLEMLNHHIQLETIAMANDEEKLLTARLDEEVYNEYVRQAGILGESVPSASQLKSISKVIVTADFHGANFSSRIWVNRTELQNELEKAISRTMIQGENPRVTARNLRRLVDDNVKNKRYVAERLAITESGRVQTETQKVSFEDFGYKQYEYIAEPTACKICSPLDGKIFNVDDMQAGENANPMHPNCRCSVAAHMDRAAWEADLKARELIDESKQETVFKPAKNLKEANEYAMDTLGIPNVSYKGLDVATANEWNKGLTESFRDFPKLKERFGFVGEAHERNKMVKKALTEAVMKKTIEANPDADLKRITAAVKRYVNKTTKPLNVPEYTMAQSWSPTGKVFKDYAGISVNNKLGKDAVTFVDSLKKQVESKFHPVGTDSIKSVFDHEVGHQLDDLLSISNNETIQKLFDARTQEALTNDLSRYAWDNGNNDRYSEMIAEGWSEYRNNPEPREMAKTIGEIIEREYNKKYR